jgi:hypothetical protein
MEPKRATPGGPLLLRLPMGKAKLSGIAVVDIGGCAAGLFLDREGTVGKTIGVAGDHLTGEEYAAVFSKARAHACVRAVTRKVCFNSSPKLKHVCVVHVLHLAQVLGVEVAYEAVPFDTWRKSGAPGAEDMANMFQFYHDFEARAETLPLPFVSALLLLLTLARTLAPRAAGGVRGAA